MKRHFLSVFLLVLVTMAAGCRGLDRRPFQRVEAASRDIQAALDGKVELARYRELLTAYADGLSEARNAAKTPRQREIVAEYEAAWRELTDIGLVWEAKAAGGSELLPIREELPGRIAREYSLGINTNEPPSIYATEAIHTIWEAARQHLRAATRDLGLGL